MATLAFKDYHVTGTINSAAPTTLVVSSDPGFQIGDGIIIATGGEPGQGQRGTFGVGGNWPALSYVDAATMNADATQVKGKFAWVEASGAVYQYDVGTPGAWQAMTYYYIAQSVPKALVTTITNIVGLTFTLADGGGGTTNADVYFDNEPIFNALTGEFDPMPSNDELVIPAGIYAIGQPLRILDKDGLTVRGLGQDTSIIMSPRGTPCVQIKTASGADMTYRDFGILGNARNNGFGFYYTRATGGGGTLVPEDFEFDTAIPGDSFCRGAYFENCTNCEIIDCKATDTWQMAFGAQGGANINATRCSIYMTEPMRAYLQWPFGWADVDGGTITDCVFDSPYLTRGFEDFRSRGLTWTRPVSRNGTFSVNAGGDWLIDSPEILIEDGSMYSPSEQQFTAIGIPIMAIAANVPNILGGFDNGGEIRNPNIVQEGYFNLAELRVLPVITSDDDCPNIRVTGEYPACDAGTNGYIEHPDGLAQNGIIILNTSGGFVDGIRVVGTNSQNVGNISAHVTGTVQNCVADKIYVNTTTQINNITNTEWSALCEIAPVNTAIPVITGTARVGSTLSSTTGTWSGSVVLSYAYQWRRGGVAIDAATSATYVAVTADLDALITCTVTATNVFGPTAATSDPVIVTAATVTTPPAPSNTDSRGHVRRPPPNKLKDTDWCL
jgi:hypothetical protein